MMHGYYTNPQIYLLLEKAGSNLLGLSLVNESDRDIRYMYVLRGAYRTVDGVLHEGRKSAWIVGPVTVADPIKVAVFNYEDLMNVNWFYFDVYYQKGDVPIPYMVTVPKWWAPDGIGESAMRQALYFESRVGGGQTLKEWIKSHRDEIN